MRNLALLLLLIACRKTVAIKGEAAESMVRKMLTDGGIETKSVSCPPTIPTEPGQAFECTAVDSTGATLTIAGKAVDETAADFNLVGAIVDTNLFTKEIRATNKNHDAVIECPAKVMVVTEQRSVTCKYTANGKSEHIKFTKAGTPKEFRWELVP